MSARINSHTISHAENIYSGDAAYPDGQGRGLPVRLTVKDDLGAPVVEDPDGYAAAQAVVGAGDLTLNGALAGVADVARNVQILSTNAGDSSQVATITGTDKYGATVVEELTFNGTTPVLGAKAFKTVSQIAISAALAGNGSAGSGEIIGLSFRIASTDDIDFTTEGSNAKVVGAGAGTAVIGDVTIPQGPTDGDVRGTYDPSAANDGVNPLVLVYETASRNTVGAFGQPQYAG